MNSNKKLKITNAWVCQIKGQKIVPVFGDILIYNGQISEIKKKSSTNSFQNLERILTEILMLVAGL